MSSISLPSLLSSIDSGNTTPSTPYGDPATEGRNAYDNIQRLLTEIRFQMTRIENIVVTIMSRLHQDRTSTASTTHGCENCQAMAQAPVVTDEGIDVYADFAVGDEEDVSDVLVEDTTQLSLDD